MKRYESVPLHYPPLKVRRLDAGGGVHVEKGNRVKGGSVDVARGTWV
jgi:hypothetical protein